MNEAAKRFDLGAALEHYSAGRMAMAELLCQQVPVAEFEHAYALLLLGLIGMDRGDTSGALIRLEQAATLLPDIATAHVSLADARRATGHFVTAVESYRRAVAIDPVSAETWNKLGETLATLGRLDEAVTCLRQALALDPKLIAPLCSLAAAGEPDAEARLSDLFNQRHLPDADRIAVGFALATLRDRVGAWDAAFACLEEVNALVRARLAASGRSFDAAAVRAYVDRRIGGCTPRFFETAPGVCNASELPVFVVGMPRSGTTLVEQILASHSQVRGIGESNAIGAIDSELALSAVSTAYGEWDGATCRRQADQHTAMLRAIGGGARRVVDKTPDNLFHLGLIGRLFPGARVILCARDLRDICLSCYFQSFAGPMPYAYCLTDCAVRALEADRLLSHWRQVLPLPIHTVRYEDLVADPETECRRMIDFLGLSWEAECLEFHRAERAVQTASIWQVRRPIYPGSVRRWQHYAKHLGPMLSLLGRRLP